MTISSGVAITAGLVFGAVILLAAVKLSWGVLLWTRGVNFRLGDRWGDEPIEVIEWSGKSGYVEAGGERWRAKSKNPLQPGDCVVVTKVKGLTLEVRKG